MRSYKFHSILSISLALLVFFPIAEITSSEPFHNISGFYGERAAGLAGAYSAISDDPSGAFYNPAGLGFAYQDSFSISASNFKESDRKYKNIDTPGQVYSQSHSNFDPNFVGILKSYENWKFGFSIVNTYNLNYDRTDQVNFPLISPSIDQTRNYTKENLSQLLIGPSAAFLLTDRLSLGFTLYYMRDTKKSFRSQFQQFADSSYVTKTFVDNRQTTGLLPIVGLQYQASDKISIGASLRRILVTGGNRLYNEVYTDSLRATSSNPVDFVEGTGSEFSSIEAGVVKLRPRLVTSIPEITELRGGIAFFPTNKFLASFEMMYTSGFKSFRSQDELSLTQASVNYTIHDKEIRELTRISTINYAAGFEYFLADSFSISSGLFTNEPNVKPVSWLESSIDLAIQNQTGNQLKSTSGGASVTYQNPRSGTDPRNEYSRNRGISLGMSWVNAKSSISLTYIRELGKGNSRIDPNSLSQSFEYSSHTFYVMVSSRN